MEMYREIKKMFKSATGLDPNTRPQCENGNFCDSQAKREPKKYTQNVKQDQLFFSWLRNGFTITMILWLLYSSQSLDIMWTNILYFSQCLKQCMKHSKLLDALKTAPKYFVNARNHCPHKAVSTKDISNMLHTKDFLEQLHLEQFKFYQ